MVKVRARGRDAADGVVVDEAIAAGLDAIRAEAGVPGDFPPEVVAAAEEVSTRLPGASHVDRTSVKYMTLDPATATDLDQAFAVDQDGDDIVLYYAIADVGFFVDPNSVLDREAWERGGTVYLPDGKVPLYPPTLSEAAASLLPTGPRPAVVFIVRIDAAGESRLDGAERAVIHSRRKLAYEDVEMNMLPPTFAELAAPHRCRRGSSGSAESRVPRAGSRAHRRWLEASLRRSAGERGPQRRDVVGLQSGGCQCAPRGEDWAVPGDA